MINGEQAFSDDELPADFDQSDPFFIRDDDDDSKTKKKIKGKNKSQERIILYVILRFWRSLCSSTWIINERSGKAFMEELLSLKSAGSQMLDSSSLLIWVPIELIWDKPGCISPELEHGEFIGYGGSVVPCHLSLYIINFSSEVPGRSSRWLQHPYFIKNIWKSSSASRKRKPWILV